VAVEALLRWNHPERGFLESSEFIELVDQTGLIVPLGKWVIEEACRQMRHWQDLYPAVRSLLVSVNLSGRQFRQASLATDVALVLRQTRLSPQSLALEIKEGDALADSKAVAATLQEFRRLGVRVTIDDFGKGWSALGSLTRFTIDDLKIDGSCVSRLGREQQDIDVVRALVGMAKAMGLDVTAGAVETGEQLAMLREIGCDRAQGRHLAPPLMADELERLFQRADEFGLRPSD
jgi:EAL domain-containing protein (putative c-di-GMP-specific phosphodiesterase class I)